MFNFGILEAGNPYRTRVGGNPETHVALWVAHEYPTLLGTARRVLFRERWRAGWERIAEGPALPIEDVGYAAAIERKRYASETTTN